MTKSLLWTPLPGPQTTAYLSDADEVFYGGSAGGGKTDLLLGLATTQHRTAIVFRREYRQLQGPEGIISRSQQLLRGTGARYNGQEMVWRDIPGGRSLEFGASQYAEDVSRYQGRSHDLVGFDELPHFLESQYRYLIGWNRTTELGRKCRVVATGNPPLSAEGEWVIRRWGAWLDSAHTDPARPGELRWFAVIDGVDTEVEGPGPLQWKDELISPRSRTFIPARLSDNPYLMATDYESTLQALPEPMRSKFLYGDFTLSADDDPWQIIPTAWVLAAQARWESRARPATPLTSLGVDVARGGRDQTVIAARYGNWIGELERHPGTSTPDGPLVAALVISALHGQDVTVNVDVIGVGSSVYDTLQGVCSHVVGVNFWEGSRGTDRSGRLGFVNVRAEAYWRLREMLDPSSGEDLALPPDLGLRADLCASRWTMRIRGIQVEDKEEVKKRLGRSPDCADAVALAMIPVAVRRTASSRQG